MSLDAIATGHRLVSADIAWVIAMKAFEFMAILKNLCFPTRIAAARDWLHHQWRGIRLRFQHDPGCLFDWLPVAIIVGTIVLLWF